jgi:8-oxo-dGTP pyrophosphatase MutT (NUDIX family)
LTAPLNQHDYAPLLNAAMFHRLRELPPLRVRARLAATLILIDRSGAKPRVLLGRRNADHAFMPGKFVFPGGRMDPGDRRMNIAGPLASPIESRLGALAPGSSDLPRALALAAIRETFEETGLVLGTREHGGPLACPKCWRAFAAHGAYPDLEPLHFVARATTPPRLPQRYDTIFFAVDASAVCAQAPRAVGPDREFVETVWAPLAEAQDLDIPLITAVVLRETERRLAAGMGHHLPTPWYSAGRGGWRRREL